MSRAEIFENILFPMAYILRAHFVTKVRALIFSLNGSGVSVLKAG
jgi:hypothetical protein